MKLSTALTVCSSLSLSAAHTIFVQLVANGQTNRKHARPLILGFPRWLTSGQRFLMAFATPRMMEYVGR